METRGRRVHAIEKSIRLLDCFWLARRPLSLRELEQMTGWAKSTIHGLLASMVDSGVVEQNRSDGKYRLGYHLFELGSAVNQGWDAAGICRPHLQRLVDRFHESAYLARQSGDELILVECCEPRTSFRITSEVGTRLPLHCSSQGKIILANRSVYEAERLLRRGKLHAYTPNTVTAPETLMAQLEQARAQGFALEREEYKLGLSSVAAPVFERSGDCRYAIGIIYMTGVGSEVFEQMRAAVIETARAATQELQAETCE